MTTETTSSYFRLLLLIIAFLNGCAPAEVLPAAVTKDIPTKDIPASAVLPAPTTTSPSQTLIPTLPSNPTLTPIGEIQPIPQGWVYLGDKKTLALGTNMNCGGGSGSLLYNGRELIDDTDDGRYFQFSMYGGNDKYAAMTFET